MKIWLSSKHPWSVDFVEMGFDKRVKQACLLAFIIFWLLSTIDQSLKSIMHFALNCRTNNFTAQSYKSICKTALHAFDA